MSQAEEPKPQQSVKSEQAAPNPAPQASTSCRKKKSENSTFFGDVLDHIDEFVHASYDEHKTCLEKTLHKMFGMSKAVSNETRPASATNPVENVMSRPATTD